MLTALGGKEQAFSWWYGCWTFFKTGAILDVLTDKFTGDRQRNVHNSVLVRIGFSIISTMSSSELQRISRSVSPDWAIIIISQTLHRQRHTAMSFRKRYIFLLLLYFHLRAHQKREKKTQKCFSVLLFVLFYRPLKLKRTKKSLQRQLTYHLIMTESFYTNNHPLPIRYTSKVKTRKCRLKPLSCRFSFFTTTRRSTNTCETFATTLFEPSL